MKYCPPLAIIFVLVLILQDPRDGVSQYNRLSLVLNDESAHWRRYLQGPDLLSSPASRQMATHAKYPLEQMICLSFFQSHAQFKVFYFVTFPIPRGGFSYHTRIMWNSLTQLLLSRVVLPSRSWWSWFPVLRSSVRSWCRVVGTFRVPWAAPSLLLSALFQLLSTFSTVVGPSVVAPL